MLYTAHTCGVGVCRDFFGDTIDTAVNVTIGHDIEGKINEVDDGGPDNADFIKIKGQAGSLSVTNKGSSNLTVNLYNESGKLIGSSHTVSKNSNTEIPFGSTSVRYISFSGSVGTNYTAMVNKGSSIQPLNARTINDNEWVSLNVTGNDWNTIANSSTFNTFTTLPVMSATELAIADANTTYKIYDDRGNLFQTGHPTYVGSSYNSLNNSYRSLFEAINVLGQIGWNNCNVKTNSGTEIFKRDVSVRYYVYQTYSLLAIYSTEDDAINHARQYAYSHVISSQGKYIYHSSTSYIGSEPGPYESEAYSGAYYYKYTDISSSRYYGAEMKASLKDASIKFSN